MAIAFDAASAANGTGDISFTHTPVGTPRGVLVLIYQDLTAAVQLTGVTYGGVAMTELTPDSPLLKTAGAEDGTLYAFFLGSSVPAGAQTVLVDTPSAGNNKRATCITVTGSDDTSVDAVATADLATDSTPSVDITTSVETALFALNGSGEAAIGFITQGADYTLISETDFGNTTTSFVRRTTNPSAGTTTVDWTTNNNESAGIFAVAIREGAGGSPQNVSITNAAETDTAQTLSYTKPILKTVGTASVTNAAQALTVTKPIQKSLTAATETDAAQALSVSGGPTSVTIIAATETNSSRALSFVKPVFKTLGPATETATAHTLGVTHVHYRTIVPAVELDAALTLTRGGVVTPGTCTVTDAAVTVVVLADSPVTNLTLAEASVTNLTLTDG